MYFCMNDVVVIMYILKVDIIMFYLCCYDVINLLNVMNMIEINR